MTRFASNALLHRKQQIWVYVIGVLFAVDFMLYGYLPTRRQMQTLHRAKTNHTRTIEAARSQEAMLPTLQKRLEEAKTTVQRYKGSIPSESELGLFMRQIAQIMASHELSDQEVVPLKGTTAGELQCIPVHMNCSGTLEGLFGFYRDLQNLGRLVRIEKASLRNDPKFGGRVTMRTEAMIFYRPSKSQEATGADEQAVSEVINDGTQ